MQNSFNDFRHQITTGKLEPSRSNLYGVKLYLPTCLQENTKFINQDRKHAFHSMNYMADSVRKKHGVDYGLATTGYVEFFDTNTAPKNITLHAWISISSANNTISELVPLNQSRLENISHVSYRLLNLFRKEIL